MGITIARAHVLLTALDGTVVHNATLLVAPTQDSLTIELPVRIQASEQGFTVRIELLDVRGTLLFARTQQVTARALGLPPAPAPRIVLEYVGPGYAARRITLSPGTVTLPAGGMLTLTASAVDSAGRAISDLLLGWRSSDTTLAVVVGTGATAVVQSTGRRGTVTISAVTPADVSGSAAIVLTPLAARLAVVSGDAQIDSVGRTLAQPLVVRATDTFGVPVAGATVSWTRILGVGAPAAASTTSDATGLARVSYVLGTTLGTDSVRASLGAATTGVATALFSARSISLSPRSITALGGGQRATVLTALPNPLVARVTDSLGNPVTGARVDWRADVPGSVTLAPETSVTGADGTTQTRATLGTTAGVVTMTANVGALSVTVQATALAGPAARLVIVTQPGSPALPSLVLTPQPAVRLADSYGNPVTSAGVTVSAAIQAGIAQLGPPGATTALTDAAGIATFSGLTLAGTPATTVSLVFRTATPSLTSLPSNPILLP
jgi:hypothetical protein